MRRFLVPLFALLFVSQVAAQEPGTSTQAPDFIRLVRDEAGTVTSLDTAIVRYDWMSLEILHTRPFLFCGDF